MNREEAMNRLARHAAAIRRRFAVQSLAVFGSVARDEAQAGSDVDVLVAFEGTADFDRVMELLFYLEELLGVPVDLVTRQALRPELRAQVEQLVSENRYIIGQHAAERLEERGIMEWQATFGTLGTGRCAPRISAWLPSDGRCAPSARPHRSGPVR